MKIDTNTIIGIILLSITSLIMFYVSFRLYKKAKILKQRCTLCVQGVVAEIVNEDDGPGEGPKPYRVYEYTVDGKLYRKKAKLSRIPNYDLGDEIDVFCDPKEPDFYYIERRSDFLKSMVSLTIALLALAGIVMYIVFNVQI